jgi:tripartite-type tricarboxylate transporter receptor subunit TctC
VAEAGLPGYAAELHYGLVAPARVPREIIERLNAALKAALADGEVKRRLAADGAEVRPSTPQDYAADIAAEQRKWSEIIRKTGLTAH